MTKNLEGAEDWFETHENSQGHELERGNAETRGKERPRAGLVGAPRYPSMCAQARILPQSIMHLLIEGLRRQNFKQANDAAA